MTAPFPAAHSILSPQALAKQVFPAFGIGAGADVRFFQGGFNDTYVVTARDSTVYYLRVYRHGWRTRRRALRRTHRTAASARDRLRDSRLD